MKAIWYACFLVLCTHAAQAQQYLTRFHIFPHGEVFPNRMTHAIENYADSISIYDLTDTGKPIVMMLFDPADSTSWSYHQSFQMQDLYNQHGTPGDNAVQVYYVPVFNFDAFGDTTDTGLPYWATDTPFPVKKIPGLWHEDLHAVEIPIMICICPDKRAYKLGLWSADSLYQAAMNCGTVTMFYDAQVIYSDIDTTGACLDETRPVNVYLSNLGALPLTSADIEVKAYGEVFQTYHWEGNLPSYHLDTIALADLPMTAFGTDVQLIVNNPNGNQDQIMLNDTLTYSLKPAPIWTVDSIRMEAFADVGWHLYWEILTEDGVRIDSGGTNILATYPFLPVCWPDCYPDQTLVSETVSLAGYNHECLTVRVISGKGYGVCCYFVDGYIRFKHGDDVIFEWKEFGHIATGKFYTDFGLTDIASSIVVSHETDSQTNGSITVTASGGHPPYEYSKDCGETFGSSSVFSNLEHGWYCMHTRDAVGQLRQDSVFVDNLTGASVAAALGNLHVQPNPAQGAVQLSFAVREGGGASVSVANMMGQMVWEQSFSTSVGLHVLHIPTVDWPEGAYFVTVGQGQQRQATRFVVLR